MALTNYPRWGVTNAVPAGIGLLAGTKSIVRRLVPKIALITTEHRIINKIAGSDGVARKRYQSFWSS